MLPRSKYTWRKIIGSQFSLFSDKRFGRVTRLSRMGTYHSPQHTHTSDKNCQLINRYLEWVGPCTSFTNDSSPSFQSCLFALINNGFFWRNAVNVVNCENSGGHFHRVQVTAAQWTQGSKHQVYCSVNILLGGVWCPSKLL